LFVKNKKVSVRFCTETLQRFTWSVLGIILTYMPFLVLFPPKSLNGENLIFSMALPALYAAVIVAGIFIYKIQLNTAAEAKEKEV